MNVQVFAHFLPDHRNCTVYVYHLLQMYALKVVCAGQKSFYFDAASRL